MIKYTSDHWDSQRLCQEIECSLTHWTSRKKCDHEIFL